jgi:hypothetical protein
MDERLERDLNKKSTQLYKDISQLINQLRPENFSGDDLVFKFTNDLKLLINEFEPIPQLLDDRLQEYIDTLLEIYLKQYTCGGSDCVTNSVGEIVYCFAKVRGFKHLAYYFSSDVYLIPTLIGNLPEIRNDNEIFLNLLWLSNLVLVPFDLDQVEPQLPQSIFQMGVENLGKFSNGSKNQLVSLILLSRLITRSDLLSQNWIDKYFAVVQMEWSNNCYTNGGIKSGHLLVINKILKRCNINYILPKLSFIYDIVSQDLTILRYFDSNFTNLNILYHIKILGKLCDFYLIESDYKKASVIINNLIHDIMNLRLDKFDTDLRYAIAKSLSTVSLRLLLQAVNYQQQVIDYLISQLGISDLSTQFSNITIDSDQITVAKYHTILLFLGYNCLNKTMPFSFIPKIMSIVHKTLFVEQRRFNTTIGSQIRDSSAFILWALCRSMKPSEFQNYMRDSKMMETIFHDLLLLTIFDSDLTIRRCGIAVIQEFVGRFGSVMFFHDDPEEKGKFLVQLVEMFSTKTIGTQVSSFTLLSKLVECGFKKELLIPTLLQKINSEYVEFETKILCSNYLKIILPMKQLKSVPFELEVKELSENDLLQSITFSYEALYFITDILEVYPEINVIQDLIEKVSNYNFDWHSDSIAKGLGFVRWTNFLLSKGFNVQSWDVLLNIMRLENSSMIHELKKLMSSLKDLPEDVFSTMVHYLTHNNVNVGQIIFYFRNFTDIQLQQLTRLLYSPISCETKASLIDCLNENIDLYPLFELDTLLELLDDYTVTNQGDVGSKVRFATVRLIHKHCQKVHNREMLHFKLIRLSGELIDKIRLESFAILTKDTQLQNLSIGQYYKRLFEYYEKINEDIKPEFWKGVSFTIAATTATSTLINESFRQFLEMYLGALEEAQHDILSHLVKLLKLEGSKLTSRQIKQYNAILNLFIKIFESSSPIPQTFNYEALYIRGYNLHINTTNVTRIGLVLKVFQHISLLGNDDVRLKLRKRVVWLSCNHKLSKVRNMAGEVLFEILNEEDQETEFLNDIDFNQPPEKLNKFQAQLQNTVISRMCGVYDKRNKINR